MIFIGLETLLQQGQEEEMYLHEFPFQIIKASFSIPR